MSALKVAPALAVTLVAACGTEFTTTPPAPVTIEPLNWPRELVVTDTATLMVRVHDSQGRVVTGLPLQWQSSNTNVLKVTTGTAPDTGSPVSALSAQLTAAAVGLGLGPVEVAVLVPAGGSFKHAEFRDTITVTEKWISISAGYTHTCGVTVFGDAYCWGGGLRLLGNGSSSGSAVPARVVGGLSYQSVSAGWEHSCGSLREGLLYCWGYNPWGALGTGSTQDELAPRPVYLGATFTFLSAGYGYTCGISTIQTALCWGDDQYGELGSVDAVNKCGPLQTRCSLTPVGVTSGGTLILRFSLVTAGERHTCGLMTTNVAYCWGDNGSGALGNPAVTATDTPVVVSGNLSFRSLSTGRYHACGVTTSDLVYCWGTNAFGELGSDLATQSCDSAVCSKIPIPVSGGLSFKQVSVRERASCGVTSDSSAYCWGLNDHGQLGTPSGDICSGKPCSKTPLRVSPSLRFVFVSVGSNHTCALTPRGSAYCWGQGEGGKLGIGSVVDSPTPARVSDPK
jgi:alpha-tubulin suppressor-like RCC1 family protein